jgi:hypothetical protein
MATRCGNTLGHKDRTSYTWWHTRQLDVCNYNCNEGQPGISYPWWEAEERSKLLVCVWATIPPQLLAPQPSFCAVFGEYISAHNLSLLLASCTFSSKSWSYLSMRQCAGKNSRRLTEDLLPPIAKVIWSKGYPQVESDEDQRKQNIRRIPYDLSAWIKSLMRWKVEEGSSISTIWGYSLPISSFIPENLARALRSSMA